MTGVTSKVDVGLAHGLAGYLFLGAVLGQMRLDTRRPVLSTLACAGGATTTVLGTAWLSERAAAFVRWHTFQQSVADNHLPKAMRGPALSIPLAASSAFVLPYAAVREIAAVPLLKRTVA